jgi:putative flavoprotein involved in K+ transport
MNSMHATERFDTIVIGGGQAGLAAGYHLAQRGLDFVILDASERVGDSWRSRWDSLRLFTPARYDGLPGMPFPASPHYFPTKDEMADFLERYAAKFDLPVRSGVRVDCLRRNGDGYLVTAGERKFEANNVVVAMANYQEPWTPQFARELDSRIVQIHSADYRNPGQLRAGRVLLVGAGNSAAEIAKELAPNHQVLLSGRDTGAIPFRIDGLAGRLLLVRLTLRVLFLRILSVDTPIGRGARPKVTGKGGPLIRVKNPELSAAGVKRVPRTIGTRGGLPVLEDGRMLEVQNVVWCTGFRAGFERWVDLPIHGDHEPIHEGGLVDESPGLYFLGLHFLRSLSSAMIHGMARDAEHIVRAIEARRPRTAGSARSRFAGQAERGRSDVTSSRPVRV